MATQEEHNFEEVKQGLAFKHPDQIKLSELKQLPAGLSQQLKLVEEAVQVKIYAEEKTRELYIAVLISEREIGFRVADIDGIIDMRSITPVPGLPSYVLGICNVRGEMTSVVNLKKILGFQNKPLQNPSRRQNSSEKIVILRGSLYSAGIIVDAVLDVVRVADADVVKVSSEDGELNRLSFCTRGVYSRPGEQDRANDVILLDTEKLLSIRELVQFQ
ncbi:MAG: CheW domain-containing protein [Chlorobiales bacterium]|jgi:purine-binding chemotaxis protein CheW|nr:CheW domain-containing protein [Chlorobiales bacterium]